MVLPLLNPHKFVLEIRLRDSELQGHEDLNQDLHVLSPAFKPPDLIGDG